MSDIENDENSENLTASFLDTEKLAEIAAAKFIQLSSNPDPKISLAAASELQKIVNSRKDREVSILRVNRPQSPSIPQIPGNTFNILANPEAVQKMTEGLLQVTAASVRVLPQGENNETSD